MKLLVISSMQVVKVRNRYTTDVTFFSLLEKASLYFSDILVLCREDRMENNTKSMLIDETSLCIKTLKFGYFNKYTSLLIETPITALKLFIILYKYRKVVDVLWIPEVRIVGILAFLVSKLFKYRAFFLYSG